MVIYMARPSAKKRICRMPAHSRFKSEQAKQEGQQIRMSVEEYETIRLIDYMAMTQEECAVQMQVARTTVQALYRDARRKLARFLVEGAGLVIEGGDILVCQGGCELPAGLKTCKQNHWQNEKGDKHMRLAVTYENETGEIFQHFGHTESFKLYMIEDGQIQTTQVMDTNGTGHGALAGMLASVGVTVLICGGIGGGARNALAEAGIEVYPGAMGNADENVKSFLAGALAYDPETMCSHHGEGHTCGSHEEGGSCGGGCK